MATKIFFAATVAAFGLAATQAAAEGGEGNGDPYPFKAPATPVSVAYVPWARDTGSSQYSAIIPALPASRLAQETLPENGQNGPVETANSLPLNALAGTPAYAQAQSTDLWMTQAERRLLQPHPTTASTDTLALRQASADDAPGDLGIHRNPGPSSRGIVQSRMHTRVTHIVHPPVFARATTHHNYASAEQVHTGYHDYLRRISRTAFVYNKHPASLYPAAQGGTREALLQAVTPTAWWDDVPQTTTFQ